MTELPFLCVLTPMSTNRKYLNLLKEHLKICFMNSLWHFFFCFILTLSSWYFLTLAAKSSTGKIFICWKKRKEKKKLQQPGYIVNICMQAHDSVTHCFHLLWAQNQRNHQFELQTSYSNFFCCVYFSIPVLSSHPHVEEQQILFLLHLGLSV